MLLISLILAGCTILIHEESEVGSEKEFEKNGITIVLTDKFREQKSQMGFDPYYVSNFCGVMVLKEDFSLEEGLENESLEEYIRNVIKNNGHTDIEPQHKDDLWFYEKNEGAQTYFAYCYKGSEAFYFVQFGCMTADIPVMEEIIHEWAKSVEVE